MGDQDKNVSAQYFISACSEVVVLLRVLTGYSEPNSANATELYFTEVGLHRLSTGRDPPK